MIIVDSNLNDIGEYQVKFFYLEIERLIGDNKLVVKKYNTKALELLTFHNIDKKLEKLEDNENSLEKLVKLNIIDE